MDRGVRGELEFGINRSGRVYARRFRCVSFTLPDMLVVGEDFVVMFQLLGGGVNSVVGKDDWVGLYPVGTANSAVKTRWYKAAGTSGAISWTRDKGPTTAGTYEFRYFRGNGYSGVVGVSDPITVIDLDSLGGDDSKADDSKRYTLCDEDEGADVAKVQVSATANAVVGTSVVPMGEFTHICVRSSGTQLSLIVNGVLEAVSPITQPVPASTLSCLIGGCKQGYVMRSFGCPVRGGGTRAWACCACPVRVWLSLLWLV